MPIFLAYDLQNISLNKSVSVDGELADAVDLLNLGGPVYRQHKKWSTVKWPGVFIPRFQPDPNISIPEELAMYLYIFREQNALCPFSFEAIKRFEAACRKKYDVLISVNYIPVHLGGWVEPPEDASEALLDDTHRVQLNNWSLQRPSITTDGSMLPGADEASVVYNTSDNGSFWLARWVYRKSQQFTVLTDPFFEDVTTELSQLAAINNPAICDTFGNSKELNYAKDDSDSEKEIEAYDEDDEASDAEGDDLPPTDSDEEETKEDDMGLEVHLFTKDERTILPLGYLTPRAMEWQYMLNAIVSNFRQVKNLLKVRDFTMREFHTILGTYPIKSKYAGGARHLLAYIHQRFQPPIADMMKKLTLQEK